MATIAKSKASEDWIIDSRSSKHILAQVEQFRDNQPTCPLMIQIGNRAELKTIGMGNIPLETQYSHILDKDVLYVPTIGSNPLSIAKIVNQERSLVFTSS